MIYSFADCVLDTKRHKLYCNGELIDVEPKVFAVLLYLLEHRGELVTRDDLLDNCWPGLYISENSLSRCLSRVRRVIGHSAQRKLIETVHTKGYRFIGEITEQPDRETMQPAAASRPGVDRVPASVTEDAAEVSALAAPGSVAVSAVTPAVTSDTENIGASPSVTATSSAAPTPDPAPSVALSGGAPVTFAVTAERRQLTVLNCQLRDLHNSKEADIEELHHWQQQYRSLALECLSPLNGSLMQTLPEGFIAYFGYPQTFEDNARRAVLAGLRFIERWRQSGLADQASIQIGIHTGSEIIEVPDNTGSRMPLAVGPIQSIAGQLCEFSDDGVVISAATARLIEGHFEYQELPPLTAASSPMQRYKVIAEKQIADALINIAFVGREPELGLLCDRWQQVQEGRGQVVWISGEPGIGKSRLVAQMRDQIIGDAYPKLECRSSPYYQNTALFPLIGLLKGILQVQVPGSEAGDVERIETLIEHYRQPKNEAVPLLAGLLSISLPPGCYPPLTLDIQQQRRRTLQLLLTMLLNEAQTRPLLLIMEDLHWADPSTLELITLLIEQVPLVPILVMLSSRPEFEPDWGYQTPVTPLPLDRFNRGQIDQLLWRLTAGKVLAAEVRQHIRDKTDGIPLFIEQLTQMLLESGQLRETERGFELNKPLEQLSIPLTLQDSLMARLDRLTAGKFIAQWASVLGREFSHELLQTVSALDDAHLQRGLDELLRAGLIYRQGLAPQIHYIFKHGLIRDTAYQSLLKRQRQTIHQATARVLETQFPDIVAEQPELLAQHYTKGGQAREAISYWYRAGQNAARRWAHEEAIEHLKTALKLLKTLPDTSERMRRELDIRIILGSSLMAVYGSTHTSARECFEQALALCRHSGESRYLLPVLSNLWFSNQYRAQYRQAKQLGEELLAASEPGNDLRQRQAAYQMIGASLIFQGELMQGRGYLQKSLDLAGQPDHQSLDVRYNYEPFIYSLCYLLYPLQFGGFFGQTQQIFQQLIVLTEQLQHPISLALVLDHLSKCCIFRHDLNALSRHVDALSELTQKHQIPVFSTICTLQQGWLMSASNQAEQGIARMQQGLADYEAITGSGRTLWRLLLAEAYAMAKRPAEGLQVLTDGLDIMMRTGERLLEPGLYYQQGMLQLQLTNPDTVTAEVSLQQALETARRQRARWWELRAAVSLAQQLQLQGKREQAVGLLTPIYDGFNEGFDSADLQQAKALLDQWQAVGR